MPRIVTPHGSFDDLPPLLTADEAAPFLRQTGRNVRRLINEGSLDSIVVQVGARKLISREQLRKLTDGEAA